MITFGRRRIFADYDAINESNIEKALSDALTIHQKNAAEIAHLRQYVKGDQPVLNRTKKIREDINNKVVVNIASEVLDFKLSYIFGAPIDIVRPANSGSTVDIGPLQLMMSEQGKDDVDQEIAQDFCIGGVGYRGVLANKNDAESAPFRMVQMVPETTFCIYKNDVFKEKLLGVSYVVRTDGTVKYTAYTKTHRYELESGTGADPKLLKTTTNGIGEIPIVEYFMPEGMGVFEKGVSLMDAYNTATSNRIDDIEQFIQSILTIFGVDLSDEALDKLKTSLCLIVPDVQEGVTPQAKYLTNNMDQTTTQSVMDDLYYHILEVCSVPGREQSSGGNTGAATEMGAGGWRKVQYSAKRIIAAWQKGDRDMYRVILSILDMSKKTPGDLRKLKITDLESKFTLSKDNDILSKTQGMLNNIQAGIHPRIAIRQSNQFSDPEQVYEESKPYIEMALERMGGAKKAEDTGGSTGGNKESGHVTNQPKGDGSMTQSVEGKGNVQKQD